MTGEIRTRTVFGHFLDIIDKTVKKGRLGGNFLLRT